VEFPKLSIVQALPSAHFHPEGGEELLRQMVGATIVCIGSTNEGGLEGGGFLIDYIPAGDTKTHRAVFAFNELGLWVEWEGLIQTKVSAPG
jgi:hypothetical protein